MGARDHSEREGNSDRLPGYIGSAWTFIREGSHVGLWRLHRSLFDSRTTRDRCRRSKDDLFARRQTVLDFGYNAVVAADHDHAEFGDTLFHHED